MKLKNNTKNFAFIALGVFVLVGTYNAVVFNSKSDLSGSKTTLVKRLDEVYGVTVVGGTKTITTWQKPPSNTITNKQPSFVPTINETSSNVAQADMAVEPAIKEELSLSLVEVINPTKWKDGLSAGEFNGSLTTNSGIIENLVISLPNTESMTVSFSEMTGNVFEYDLNGSSFSGMMYQVDQYSYMVTLTNGPLEGTRLRFSANESSQNQDALAELNNVEIGSFGTEIQEDAIANNENEVPGDAAQAQSFNFDQSTTL